MPPIIVKHLKSATGESETQVKDLSSSPATVVTIEQLEEKVLAAIGKWAVAIIGTLLAIAITATSKVSAQDNRIERLESFQQSAAVRFEKQDELNDKFSDIARDVRWITEYMGKPRDNNP